MINKDRPKINTIVRGIDHTKVTVGWFASSLDMLRMGPFETQVEAWKACRLVKSHKDYRSERPFSQDTMVWPEFI